MDTYHVTPVDDIKEHEESADCPCGPEVEEYTNGRVIVHNAWDGREAVEAAIENAGTNTN